MNGVTSTQALDFFRAAENFYRQDHWRSVGANEPIKVECDSLEGGSWIVLVLGIQPEGSLMPFRSR